MKVAIRVDASRAMGIGHLRRCLSLAHAFAASGDDVRFVVRDLGIPVAALLEESGFPVALLAAPAGGFAPDPAIAHSAWGEVSQLDDAGETVRTLADWRADWVVVDSYAFDARWHRAVAEALECRIAAVDDLADRPFAAEVVIDHNFAEDHRVKYAGRVQPSATLLGGPGFALLGPGFAEAKRYPFNEAVRSIGVFLGGVDAPNFSPRILRAIDAAGFDGLVEIVSTAANPNLAELQAAVAARKGTVLSLDLPDLAAFFARHDLQIGAAGGATWERCCIGVPSLLLITADNQRAVAPNLVAHDVVAEVESFEEADIAAAIRSLIASPEHRRTLATNARNLVDGLGAGRVAAAMRRYS